MSWRLPPRSSRWRWCLPELASSGATPAWRASWASEGKRSIGPISPSSLAALKGPQPASSSRRGASVCVRACSSRSSSRIERVRLRQRRVGRARSAPVSSARGGPASASSRSSQTVRSSAPSGTASVGSSSCRCQRNRCWQRRRSATRSSRWSTRASAPATSPRLPWDRRAAAPAAPPWRRRAHRSESDLPRHRPRRRCGASAWRHPHQPLARLQQRLLERDA